jgi:hypothetical protein
MVRHFLRLTRDHILALLDGPRKDPDANNATILLKALQIVFEKEMSVWLKHECNTILAQRDGRIGTAGTATSSSQAPRQSANGNQEAIEPIVESSAAYHGYMVYSTGEKEYGRVTQYSEKAG